MSHSFEITPDVLIAGGGNAALCAAISARLAGADVLVVEKAPKFYRGGNTRHTRNMRCAHEEANDHLIGPYHEDEFWNDLLRVLCRAQRHLEVLIFSFDRWHESRNPHQVAS